MTRSCFRGGGSSRASGRSTLASVMKCRRCKENPLQQVSRGTSTLPGPQLAAFVALA